MPKRIKVLTPSGPRSIMTQTYEDLNKITEANTLVAGQSTITTTFVLSENDSVYYQGVLQGVISELSGYSIASTFVLNVPASVFGGEVIHVVPFK